MITPQKIQQITPELSLYRYHEIDVLRLQHAVGSAEIALQGAHLLRWQPAHATQPVLWLSDIEPFNAGEAIRGGVPICYPWFGASQQPIHGTARLQLWQLTDYQLDTTEVRFTLTLLNEAQTPQATVNLHFSDTCRITFTHHGTQPAQAALHSYFQVSDIHAVEVADLPDHAFNAATQQPQSVPTPRRISEHVDCIYPATSTQHRIRDPHFQRQIQLNHQHASDIVLWNPWHNRMSVMQPDDYRHMLCLETARISQPLVSGESISVEVAVRELE